MVPLLHELFTTTCLLIYMVPLSFCYLQQPHTFIPIFLSQSKPFYSLSLYSHFYSLSRFLFLTPAMSAIKANQISEALKDEELSTHQLMPFAIDTVEAPPNLFSSFHTNMELSEFSEQNHQESYELFSLQAKKYSDIVLSDQSETISNAPIKWMSSKMRLMRKMMAQEQITMNKSSGKIESVLHQQIKRGNISPSGAEIRVCSFCSTTKTPLWRSGPQGPKSLCNACGIRQMKAKRATTMAGVSTKQNKAMIIRNEKKFDVDPYKKRYKFTDADHEKLKFDGSLIGSRESSSAIFHSTFPQDEKDAAILLMTLSFG